MGLRHQEAFIVFQQKLRLQPAFRSLLGVICLCGRLVADDPQFILPTVHITQSIGGIRLPKPQIHAFLPVNPLHKQGKCIADIAGPGHGQGELHTACLRRLIKRLHLL